MGAAVLALAAAAAWVAASGTRAGVRIQLRLAAVLYAVMAAASLSELTRLPATLALTALGPSLVAFAFLTGRGYAPQPALSASLLGAATLAGIAAAATGVAAISVVPQLLAGAARLVLSRDLDRAGRYRALAALSLLAAAASLLVPDRLAAVSVLLFSAAGILAGALASGVGVDKRTRAEPWPGIGRLR